MQRPRALNDRQAGKQREVPSVRPSSSTPKHTKHQAWSRRPTTPASSTSTTTSTSKFPQIVLSLCHYDLIQELDSRLAQYGIYPTGWRGSGFRGKEAGRVHHTGLRTRGKYMTMPRSSFSSFDRLDCRCVALRQVGVQWFEAWDAGVTYLDTS